MSHDLALGADQLRHVWPPAGGTVAPGVLPHVGLARLPAAPSGGQETRAATALLVLAEGEFVEPGVRLVPARELPTHLREREVAEATVVDVPRGALAAVLARPEELGLLVAELSDGERLTVVLSNRVCATPGRYLAALVSLDGHDPAALWPEELPTGLAASPRVRLLVWTAWEFHVDAQAPTVGALRVLAEGEAARAAREARAGSLGRALTAANPEASAALTEVGRMLAEDRHDRRFSEALGLASPEDALRLPPTLSRRADPTGLGHLSREAGPAALQRARDLAPTLGTPQAEVAGRPLHGVMPDLPTDPKAAAAALERSFSFLVPALPPEADQ